MGGVAFALEVIELVVFTTLAPPAAIAYVVVAGRFLVCHWRDRETPVPSATLMAPLALVTLGFVISATHLGNPSNALYVFTRVGSSGLSNEVLATGVFLFSAGLFWVASLLRRPPKPLENAWLLLTMAAAFAYLLCTSRAYSIPTIPTWNTAEAQASLLLVACASGFLLGRACLACQGARDGGDKTSGGTPARRSPKVGTLFGTVLAAAACATMLLQYDRVSDMSNAFGAVVDRVPHYLAFVIAYGALVVAGHLVLSLGLRRHGTPVKPVVAQDSAIGARRGRLVALAVASVALVYVGTFLVRFQFYCMYMTS